MSGEALERVLAELEGRTLKWKEKQWQRNGGAVEMETRRRSCRARRSSACSPSWSMAGGGRRVARRHEEGRFGDEPVEIAFPSAMALSHVARQGAPRPERPQPARHVAAGDRVALLGAREAAYAMPWPGGESRAKDADGTPLSDEAVLAAADFGLFVDLSSMCQKRMTAARRSRTASFATRSAASTWSTRTRAL